MTTDILMVAPKYVHNVCAAIRASSCYGGGGVFYTGNRFDLDKMSRLPREERMKGYADSPWKGLDSDRRPIDTIIGDRDVVPVAIELTDGSEILHEFEHPDNALYVFGPEDGSIPKGIRHACHRFVHIPTFHCTNLSAAVYTVLYDRMAKRIRDGLESIPSVAESEQRGYWHFDELEER